METMRADVRFMAWLAETRPELRGNYSPLMLEIHAAWIAGRASVLTPSRPPENEPQQDPRLEIH